MPFLASKKPFIPEKDICSWYFDDPQYPLDKSIYFDAKDPQRHYTGASARTAIRRLIAGFHHLGLQDEDCVCVMSFNDVDYPIVVNGIIGFGGVFTGANPSYGAAELLHHFKISKTRALIVEPELLKLAAEAADKLGIKRDRILVFDRPGCSVPAGYKSWRSLLEHGEKDWLRFNGSVAKTKTAARLFSSGTTGLPKAADLTHHNLIAQHVAIAEFQNPLKDYAVKRLVAIPIFHAAAVPSVHFSPLRDGAQIYLLRRFELEPFLHGLERHAISDLTIVPALVIAIIGDPRSEGFDLRSLRFIQCGAAPLDRGPQSRLQKLVGPQARVTQAWGMTETSCGAIHFPCTERDDTGSIGYAIEGLDIKLVDDDGNDITGYDVKGEICVRGPTVINGYFENDTANRRDWDSEKFFHTGDIGYCDRATGKWYIVDRKKELIKVRGFQVAPAEIEGAVLEVPGIVDAAVIGVFPDQSGSELPRAYVVRRPGDKEAAQLKGSDVLEHIEKSLAKYKWLTGGVKFLDAIPRNASGKILKRVLRDDVKREELPIRSKL